MTDNSNSNNNINNNNSINDNANCSTSFSPNTIGSDVNDEEAFSPFSTSSASSYYVSYDTLLSSIRSCSERLLKCGSVPPPRIFTSNIIKFSYSSNSNNAAIYSDVNRNCSTTYNSISDTNKEPYDANSIHGANLSSCLGHNASGYDFNGSRINSDYVNYKVSSAIRKVLPVISNEIDQLLRSVRRQSAESSSQSPSSRTYEAIVLMNKAAIERYSEKMVEYYHNNMMEQGVSSEERFKQQEQHQRLQLSISQKNLNNDTLMMGCDNNNDTGKDKGSGNGSSSNVITSGLVNKLSSGYNHLIGSGSSKNCDVNGNYYYYYPEAEAECYLSAANIWIAIERERRRVNYPTTADALAFAVLCACAACGVLLRKVYEDCDNPIPNRYADVSAVESGLICHNCSTECNPPNDKPNSLTNNNNHFFAVTNNVLSAANNINTTNVDNKEGITSSTLGDSTGNPAKGNFNFSNNRGSCTGNCSRVIYSGNNRLICPYISKAWGICQKLARVLLEFDCIEMAADYFELAAIIVSVDTTENTRVFSTNNINDSRNRNNKKFSTLLKDNISSNNNNEKGKTTGIKKNSVKSGMNIPSHSHSPKKKINKSYFTDKIKINDTKGSSKSSFRAKSNRSTPNIKGKKKEKEVVVGDALEMEELTEFKDTEKSLLSISNIVVENVDSKNNNSKIDLSFDSRFSLKGEDILCNNQLNSKPLNDDDAIEKTSIADCTIKENYKESLVDHHASSIIDEGIANYLSKDKDKDKNEGIKCINTNCEIRTVEDSDSPSPSLSFSSVSVLNNVKSDVISNFNIMNKEEDNKSKNVIDDNDNKKEENIELIDPCDKELRSSSVLSSRGSNKSCSQSVKNLSFGSKKIKTKTKNEETNAVKASSSPSDNGESSTKGSVFDSIRDEYLNGNNKGEDIRFTSTTAAILPGFVLHFLYSLLCCAKATAVALDYQRSINVINEALTCADIITLEKDLLSLSFKSSSPVTTSIPYSDEPSLNRAKTSFLSQNSWNICKSKPPPAFMPASSFLTPSAELIGQDSNISSSGDFIQIKNLEENTEKNCKEISNTSVSLTFIAESYDTLSTDSTPFIPENTADVNINTDIITVKTEEKVKEKSISNKNFAASTLSLKKTKKMKKIKKDTADNQAQLHSLNETAKVAVNSCSNAIISTNTGDINDGNIGNKTDIGNNHVDLSNVIQGVVIAPTKIVQKATKFPGITEDVKMSINTESNSTSESPSPSVDKLSPSSSSYWIPKGTVILVGNVVSAATSVAYNAATDAVNAAATATVSMASSAASYVTGINTTGANTLNTEINHNDNKNTAIGSDSAVISSNYKVNDKVNDNFNRSHVKNSENVVNNNNVSFFQNSYNNGSVPLSDVLEFVKYKKAIEMNAIEIDSPPKDDEINNNTTNSLPNSSSLNQQELPQEFDIDRNFFSNNDVATFQRNQPASRFYHFSPPQCLFTIIELESSLIQFRVLMFCIAIIIDRELQNSFLSGDNIKDANNKKKKSDENLGRKKKNVHKEKSCDNDKIFRNKECTKKTEYDKNNEKYDMDQSNSSSIPSAIFKKAIEQVNALRMLAFALHNCTKETCGHIYNNNKYIIVENKSDNKDKDNLIQDINDNKNPFLSIINKSLNNIKRQFPNKKQDNYQRDTKYDYNIKNDNSFIKEKVEHNDCYNYSTNQRKEIDAFTLNLFRLSSTMEIIINCIKKYYIFNNDNISDERDDSLTTYPMRLTLLSTCQNDIIFLLTAMGIRSRDASILIKRCINSITSSRLISWSVRNNTEKK